tara:strand:+ start:7269 stop:8432 length:1164 start_codon:yes stop_codon:yes gene_type:complete
MTPNLGSPLPADEMLHHQTADLMGRVSESDLGWTEKIWFSIPKKDGSLQIDFGLGRYQNRNIMDGFAGISRNCEQWTVRGSRVLASDPVATSVGPIEYEVVEPLKILRARLQENEVQPISFEIEFEALNPPFCEDRHLQRDEGGYRAVSDIVRYHQAGSVKGWVSVEGKREDIKTDDWIAFRDHSWGVRLDVGASPVDLKPARDWGDKKLAEAAFLLQWSPMFMERPNGERFEYHYYLQMRDHKPFYFSGYRNLSDGTQERIARIRPNLRYDDVTRRMLGGTIEFDMLNGENHAVEVEVPGESGFHLGTALYLGFEGKKHGMYRGELFVDGEKIDNTKDPETLRRIHQLRDCPIRIREGDAVGYGIFESVLIGPWPEYGLTSENSFI